MSQDYSDSSDPTPEDFGEQGRFNIYDPEGFPTWTRCIFLTPQEQKTMQKKLLAILRQADSPKTKRELAEALYPKAFDDRCRSVSTVFFNGYENVNCAIASEKKFVARTGEVIRSIHRDVRVALSTLESEEERSRYLREVSLPVAIAEGDDGEALYVYQGVDLSQPLETLRDAIEWAEHHQAQQSQPSKLMQSLYNAIAGNQVSPQLDTSFETPDDEMDQELGDIEESM